MGDHPLGLLRAGQQPGGGVGELDVGLWAGEVHGDQRGACHTRRRDVHGV